MFSNLIRSINLKSWLLVLTCNINDQAAYFDDHSNPLDTTIFNSHPKFDLYQSLILSYVHLWTFVNVTWKHLFLKWWNCSFFSLLQAMSQAMGPWMSAFRWGGRGSGLGKQLGRRGRGLGDPGSAGCPWCGNVMNSQQKAGYNDIYIYIYWYLKYLYLCVYIYM